MPPRWPDVVLLTAGTAPDARLLTGPRGGRISTAVLCDVTHWDDVVTKLGYEHLRRHDLRHTGLTWFADTGFHVHMLRKIAGHGSLPGPIAMVRRHGQGRWSPTGPQERSRAGFGYLRNRP